jgi:hypothetical protein
VALTRMLKAVLALGAALGCSFAVDTSDLDAGCPGQRLCDGVCVSNEDPAYGCTPGVCGPPCTQPNGIPFCDRGECALKVCRYGFCGPGCDTNYLTSEDACGSCDNSCDPGQRCVNGECMEAATTTRTPSGASQR